MEQLITLSQPTLLSFQAFPKVFYRQGGQNIKSQRIMVLCRGILLDEMIASLLCDEQDLQISFTRMDHEEVIAQAIFNEKPQTVVMCETADFSVEKLDHLLEDLHYSDSVQIIVVSLYENSLVINSKKKHFYTNFRNFVHLIKNNSWSIQ